MKKALVIATTLLALTATPVAAETVRTCSSSYGGGEVCGETTTTTTHTVVETGANDNQLVTMLLSLAGAATVATVLYKLTYKSYLLG